MRITINGEDRDFGQTLTISELLEDLQLDTRKIAVEHNREIAAKSAYKNTKLADGDELEIVAFIGGG